MHPTELGELSFPSSVNIAVLPGGGGTRGTKDQGRTEGGAIGRFSAPLGRMMRKIFEADPTQSDNTKSFVNFCVALIKVFFYSC